MGYGRLAMGLRREGRGAKRALGISGMRFVASLLLSTRGKPDAPHAAVCSSETYRFKTLRFPIKGILPQ